MATWLLDTALFQTFASPKAASLAQRLESDDTSLFLSAASLTLIAAAIAIVPATQSDRSVALRKWYDDFITVYADRIHPIDSEIATRAGAILPRIQGGFPRHRFHDALLIATAQIHGHGLLTRRDGIFGLWTGLPISVI